MAVQSQPTLAPRTPPAEPRTRTTLRKDDDHELVATWLAPGAGTGIFELRESEAWIHLMRGDVLVERWVRDDRGTWARSRMVMRPGDSARMPRGALLRIEALSESSLVASYSPPLVGDAHPIDPALADAIERAAR